MTRRDAMFIRFEENPNCGFTDDRVFTARSEPRNVAAVLRRRDGADVWCAVIGVDAKGFAQPALACKVEDSGEGICYLVFGGLWGLRLRPPTCTDPWSTDDTHQWGEALLLLPADGADLRFDS